MIRVIKVIIELSELCFELFRVILLFILNNSNIFRVVRVIFELFRVKSD